MKIKIISCICSEPVNKYGDIYDGMPQLKVTDYNEKCNTQYYEAFCPKCGRGGLIQFKSAYLALKNWNEMQKNLREFEERRND